jgi:hypothetical protein
VTSSKSLAGILAGSGAGAFTYHTTQWMVSHPVTDTNVGEREGLDLEHELVLADGDRSDQNAVQLLVILLVLCTAHVHQLPFEL